MATTIILEKKSSKNIKLIIGGFILTSITLLFSVIDFEVENSKTTPKVKISQPKLLFRGIPETHTMSNYAEKGIAKPFDLKNGHEDPYKHNDGNTNSKFTSWTPNLKVALKFATNDLYGPCDGFLLVKEFNSSNKNELFDMEQSFTGDFYNEREILVKGLVKDCLVIPITQSYNLEEIMSEIYKFVN